MKSILLSFFLIILANNRVSKSTTPTVLGKTGIDKVVFQRGEFLRYNIHYGLIDAGEATFSVLDTELIIAKKPHFHLVVTGRTYLAWDVFYKVRDNYHSYVSTDNLKPILYTRKISEGDFTSRDAYWFNYNERIAKGKTDEKEKEVPIPDTLFDLASMAYYARCVNFRDKEIGATLPMNIFFEGEWFPSSATYTGNEVIKTHLGTFNCLVIKPNLIKGRVFKGQNDMVVYVSNDENQLPLRIESQIFVGSIKVDLVEHKNLKYPLSSKIE